MSERQTIDILVTENQERRDKMREDIEEARDLVTNAEDRYIPVSSTRTETRRSSDYQMITFYDSF